MSVFNFKITLSFPSKANGKTLEKDFDSINTDSHPSHEHL